MKKLLSKNDSLDMMSKHVSDNELNRFIPWIEMKFKNKTPVCRSFHACTSYNGYFLVYGGEYGGLNTVEDLTCAKDIWVLQPSVKQHPVWNRLVINDKLFVLPDNIKRH